MSDGERRLDVRNRLARADLSTRAGCREEPSLMNVRLTDLTPMQVRALALLEDGVSHYDSIGADAETLSRDVDEACVTLVHMGLVQLSFGWHGKTWFRLTERGRQVLEQGSV